MCLLKADNVSILCAYKSHTLEQKPRRFGISQFKDFTNKGLAYDKTVKQNHRPVLLAFAILLFTVRIVLLTVFTSDNVRKFKRNLFSKYINKY